MNKFKLGFIGCILFLVEALPTYLALVSPRGIPSLAGSIFLLVATFELRKKFQSSLYPIAGSLILISHFTGLLLPSSIAYTYIIPLALFYWVCWILLGVSFIVTRQAVGKALGSGQESLVLVTGILLIITSFSPIVQIGGFIPLTLAFYRFAKETSPTPKPTIQGVEQIRKGMPMVSVFVSLLAWALFIGMIVWSLPTQTYTPQGWYNRTKTTALGEAYNATTFLTVFASVGVGAVARVMALNGQKRMATVGFASSVILFISMFAILSLFALASIE